MRFIVFTIMIVSLFSTILEASYMRSVRVASFLTQEAADQSLYELKRLVRNDDRLRELQYQLGFQTKIIRSGRYYVTVLEPITNRRSLQEILDIVREVYPNAYPKRIKHPSYTSVQPKEYRSSHHRVSQETKNQEENNLDFIANVDTMLQEEVVPQEKKVVRPQYFQYQKEKPTNPSPETTTKEVTTPKQHKTEEKKEKESYKRFELKRTVPLEPQEEEKEEKKGFTLFGYEISMIDFSKIHWFDFFHSDKKEETSSDETGEKHDSINGKMSVFKTYKLEILGVLAFFFLLVLLKLIAVYRANKEDKISIQDIYDD
ncbi:High-affnity carbon uptake protein Hat/HatR [hydrothermal vent metagenome]|uniref:High-affnity carbon uptake protein Hat/HatR n=1 Tax=hydrothermal vent metagenome TaxID=652676 RepID=A0A1W1D217_9ZZZZ